MKTKTKKTTETTNIFLPCAVLVAQCVPVLIGLAGRWDRNANDPEVLAAFIEVCDKLRTVASALDSFEG